MSAASTCPFRRGPQPVPDKHWMSEDDVGSIGNHQSPQRSQSEPASGTSSLRRNFQFLCPCTRNVWAMCMCSRWHISVANPTAIRRVLSDAAWALQRPLCYTTEEIEEHGIGGRRGPREHCGTGRHGPECEDSGSFLLLLDTHLAGIGPHAQNMLVCGEGRKPFGAAAAPAGRADADAAESKGRGD